MSSSADEVRGLRARARARAQALGQPVRLWLADKQDAFVKAIRSAFPGVPHRYGSNHFLRELAKPTLEADSHAKVPMRKKVRGLRGSERQVRRVRPVDPEAAAAAPDPAGQVVRDYCGAVPGIRNDDQGGPLRPPGRRRAEALGEVRDALGRARALRRPGPAHGQLARLAGYSDEGLAAAPSQREQVEAPGAARAAVASSLAPEAGGLRQQRAWYRQRVRPYEGQGGAFYGRLAQGMQGWQPGLFVAVGGKGGRRAPWDNLELERGFRLPKGHERKLHGRCHAGVRRVQEGATLLRVLDAHRVHPEPLTAQALLPYRYAKEPADPFQAIQRRKVMRKARSPKNDRSSLPS